MLLDGLKPYLDDLASGSPAPGGGAAAAVTVAQGIALLSMVCNLTIGKKKYIAVEHQVKEILALLEVQRSEAMDDAVADVMMFNQVMAAYRLPANSDSEKSLKAFALEKATRDAAQIPLRLALLAAEILPVADKLEKIGNPNVLSDVLVGRHLLVAGLRASAENVEINLKGLPIEDPFVSEARNKLQVALATAAINPKPV